VSWYDAVAFCRWVSSKLGYEVRLPMEQEWQKAARGQQGLRYPYGSDFDESKGNTYETGIRQTSAVGIFANGTSLCGVADMSGNVFEWYLNEYDQPDNIQLTGTVYRVLQGIVGRSARLRSGNLSLSYNPITRYVNIGFRIVSPSSSV
jgi:formylglycine-generating enzyme required for sulfatase activity